MTATTTTPEADGVRVVLVTCAPADAQALADALVASQLVACVNVLPQIVSTYRWQGEVARDAEALLLIKTRAENVAELTGRIRELHRYELPEVIAVPVVGGLPDYIEWVRAESRPPPPASPENEET